MARHRTVREFETAFAATMDQQQHDAHRATFKDLLSNSPRAHLPRGDPLKSNSGRTFPPIPSESEFRHWPTPIGQYCSMATEVEFLTLANTASPPTTTSPPTDRRLLNTACIHPAPWLTGPVPVAGRDGTLKIHDGSNHFQGANREVVEAIDVETSQLP